MRICPEHLEYPVPMIFTFAFRYTENWCPYCDLRAGMLGDGISVEETPELKERHEAYKKMVDPYLHARSALECSRLEYPRGSGTWITPAELPAEVIAEYKAIRDAGWETGRKVEEWKP